MRNPSGLLAVLTLAGSLAFPIVCGVSQASDAESDSQKHVLRYRFHAEQVLRWKVIHLAKIRTTVSGTTQTAETVSQSVKIAWRNHKDESYDIAIKAVALQYRSEYEMAMMGI